MTALKSWAESGRRLIDTAMGRVPAERKDHGHGHGKNLVNAYAPSDSPLHFGGSTGAHVDPPAPTIVKPMLVM